MKQTVFAMITCALAAAVNAVGQAPSRMFIYDDSKHLAALPCMGVHPDSVAGNYLMECPGTCEIWGNLNLKPDGKFYCTNMLGTIILTRGHWDLTAEGELLLNTGRPQVEVEEVYIDGGGDHGFLLLDKVTEGCYRYGGQGDTVVVVSDGKEFPLKCNKNGFARQPDLARVDSIVLKGWNGLLRESYAVKSPYFANYFIIKKSICLQFDNSRWTLKDGTWLPVSGFWQSIKNCYIKKSKY